MKKHSEEVEKFRGMLSGRIRNMDHSKFSIEDAMFLLSICYDCIVHIENTGGDEN